MLLVSLLFVFYLQIFEWKQDKIVTALFVSGGKSAKNSVSLSVLLTFMIRRRMRIISSKYYKIHYCSVFFSSAILIKEIIENYWQEWKKFLPHDAYFAYSCWGTVSAKATFVKYYLIEERFLVYFLSDEMLTDSKRKKRKSYQTIDLYIKIIQILW